MQTHCVLDFNQPVCGVVQDTVTHSVYSYCDDVDPIGLKENGNCLDINQDVEHHEVHGLRLIHGVILKVECADHVSGVIATVHRIVRLTPTNNVFKGWYIQTQYGRVVHSIYVTDIGHYWWRDISCGRGVVLCLNRSNPNLECSE